MTEDRQRLAEKKHKLTEEIETSLCYSGVVLVALASVPRPRTPPASMTAGRPSGTRPTGQWSSRPYYLKSSCKFEMIASPARILTKGNRKKSSFFVVTFFSEIVFFELQKNLCFLTGPAFFVASLSPFIFIYFHNSTPFLQQYTSLVKIKDDI